MALFEEGDAPNFPTNNTQTLHILFEIMYTFECVHSGSAGSGFYSLSHGRIYESEAYEPEDQLALRVGLSITLNHLKQWSFSDSGVGKLLCC